VEYPIASRKGVAQAIPGDLWSTDGLAEKHNLRLRHCLSVVRTIEGLADKQPVAAKQIHHITWHGVAPRRKKTREAGKPIGTFLGACKDSFGGLIAPEMTTDNILQPLPPSMAFVSLRVLAGLQTRRRPAVAMWTYPRDHSRGL